MTWTTLHGRLRRQEPLEVPQLKQRSFSLTVYCFNPVLPVLSWVIGTSALFQLSLPTLFVCAMQCIVRSLLIVPIRMVWWKDLISLLWICYTGTYHAITQIRILPFPSLLSRRINRHGGLQDIYHFVLFMGGILPYRLTHCYRSCLIFILMIIVLPCCRTLKTSDNWRAFALSNLSSIN